jgi:hypothetical protein
MQTAMQSATAFHDGRRLPYAVETSTSSKRAFNHDVGNARMSMRPDPAAP